MGRLVALLPATSSRRSVARLQLAVVSDHLAVAVPLPRAECHARGRLRLAMCCVVTFVVVVAVVVVDVVVVVGGVYYSGANLFCRKH